MKIELHMIQNFPPACLNRDDTNSPKDCMFGDVRRARISSQCLKRAIRWDAGFREKLAGALSTRSLRFPTNVKDALRNMDVDQSTATAVATALQAIAKKEGKEEPNSRKKAPASTVPPDIFKTPQIAFYTQDEVQECARRIKDSLDKGTKPKDIIKKLLAKDKGSDPQLPPPRTADIAMFGRMITSDAFKNVDAACQVAHAISTNKVSMEMDFFTAVDDLQPDEETGAGMMGVIGYNSACFYRYAVINVPKLVENLGGDRDLARRTVEAFLHASATALPTGKQNTFAAHSRPDFILAAVRNGGAPLSLVNAFVKPATAWDGCDLTQASVNALATFWTDVTGVYGDANDCAALPCCGPTAPTDMPDGWDNVGTLKALIQRVLTAIDEEGSA